MSNEKDKAWTALCVAATNFAGDAFDKAKVKALSNAAIQWAAACAGAVTGTNGQKLRSGAVMPFGRSKGVAIEEATTKDLKWTANALSESIIDPDKARWRDANELLLKAIQKELAAR